MFSSVISTRGTRFGLAREERLIWLIRKLISASYYSYSFLRSYSMVWATKSFACTWSKAWTSLVIFSRSIWWSRAAWFLFWIKIRSYWSFSRLSYYFLTRSSCFLICKSIFCSLVIPPMVRCRPLPLACKWLGMFWKIGSSYYYDYMPSCYSSFDLGGT